MALSGLCSSLRLCRDKSQSDFHPHSGQCCEPIAHGLNPQPLTGDKNESS